MNRIQARLLLLAAPLFGTPPTAQTSNPSPGTPPNPPELHRSNVIVIVLDDVGIENLGFYEYNSDLLRCEPPVYSGGPLAELKTPELEALADDGVVFRRAYSYPVCSSSRAAIMTGRHAFRTGMGELNVHGPWALQPSERTIPEMLKGGFPAWMPPYQCGAFGKWDLSNAAAHLDPADHEMHPIHQGFDYFSGSMSGVGSHFNWTKVVAQPSGASTVTESGTARYTASVVREDALNWIGSVDEPFFAYVCFQPPHKPFQVPPEAALPPATWVDVVSHAYNAGDPPDAGDERRVYEWMMESVDFEIGALLDGLGARRARTNVVVVGDNGTPRDVLLAPYEKAHGKGTVYEQGVRVPFLVSGPQVAGSDYHEGVVSVVDVWKTVAKLTSATPGTGGTDSRSLYGLLQNPAASLQRKEVLVEWFVDNGIYDFGSATLPTYHVCAMVDAEFKYIRARLLEPSDHYIEEVYRLTDGLVPYDPTECDDVHPILGSLPYEARIQELSDAMDLLVGGP